MYVANPFENHNNKKTSGSGRVDMASGETKTLRLPLYVNNAFDPSQVEALRVFTGKHVNPVKLKLESVRAVK